MNIIKQYHKIINKIVSIWTLLILLGLFFLFNFIFFPLFITHEVKLLDTRFYYSYEEAADYVLVQDETEISNSLLMHSTVDLIYPIVYTLLLSCIIFLLKGSMNLISLPLLAFAADLLENIFIILILKISQQNGLYTILTIAASITTPIKWSILLLIICVIIYLINRRIYEK